MHKKWCIQGELFGLTKKKEKKTSRCNIRALFTRKAPTNNNKTGTSKVGAISKAQKVQKFFF